MEIPSQVFSGHILSMGFWSLKPTQFIFRPSCWAGWSNYTLFSMWVWIFDATVCHFGGFTMIYLQNPKTNSPVFLSLQLEATKSCWFVGSLQRFSDSLPFLPGEAGHAEVDAALKLLTSPEGILSSDFESKRFGNDQRGNWDLGFSRCWRMDGRCGFQGGWNLTVQTLRNIDEESQYGTNIWNFHAFCAVNQTGRGAVSLWLPHVDLGCDTEGELWVSWYGGRSHEQCAEWSNAESTPTWP